MFILALALIFGIVVLIVLLREMRKFKIQMKGSAGEKIRAILKLILLIEDILFILIFAAVIIKTLII